MSPHSTFRRLIGLRPREWRDLFVAQREVLAAWWLVRTKPTGSLAQVDASEPLPSLDSPPRTSSEIDACVLAIHRAVRTLPMLRAKCLVKSVALHRMLKRRGVPGSRVRVGVRLDQGQLDAHAWVVLGERVIGDPPSHVGRFSHLPDLGLDT